MQFLQQRCATGEQGSTQRIEPAEAAAQPGQIARAGALQRDAAGDALDVGHALERIAHGMHCLAGIAEQRFDGGVAGAGNGAVTQRVVQRVLQAARAHRGDAAVDQRPQRRLRLAAQGLGQFQIAPRGGVEADIGALALDDDGAHMRQIARLRGLGIAHQGAGGGDLRAGILDAETGQRGDREARAQVALGGLAVEMPVRATGLRGGRGEGQGQRIRQYDLGRADALKGCRQALVGNLGGT